MHIDFWKKGIVLGTIILFIGAGIIPSLGGTVVEKTTVMDSKSGGYIQDLIDNASEGDTINIPSGTYYENIVIDKSISLIGENQETTIIDGSGNGDVIYVSTDWVNISGFTIRNSGEEYHPDYDAGIDIYSNYNTIMGNNLSNHNLGIYLYESYGNTISGNIISNNIYGIYLTRAHKNTIKSNNILNNWKGIYLKYSYGNTIQNNNFIDDGQDVFFVSESIFLLFKRNRWKQNYWNESRLLPKLIHGEIPYQWSFGAPGKNPMPWFNIDWRPALKPYDI